MSELFQLDYFGGPLSNHFPVEVIHGGYFLCAGKHRGYHKGHSIWYDYRDIDNWTPNVVASLVEEIGYEFEGRIRAYWCVPGLTVYKNGLREIKYVFSHINLLTLLCFSTGYFFFTHFY